MLGLTFLLFVSLDLVFFGVLPLNSAVITILPLLGLVLGSALGGLLGRHRAETARLIESTRTRMVANDDQLIR